MNSEFRYRFTSVQNVLNDCLKILARAESLCYLGTPLKNVHTSESRKNTGDSDVGK